MALVDLRISNEHVKSSDYFAVLRVKRDLDEILRENDSSSIIFANPIDENPFSIEAAILGPQSSPYENGVFLLNIELHENYPFFPPKSIFFKRATMHPNVDEYGRFMSDLWKKESWSPSMSLKTILEHIWARLAIPDVDSDECDPTRAHSYRTDKERFELLARDYSRKYAAAVAFQQ